MKISLKMAMMAMIFGIPTTDDEEETKHAGDGEDDDGEYPDDEASRCL